MKLKVIDTPHYLSQLAWKMPRYLTDSAWIEHGPFGMWLVEATRPKMIVELGVYSGFSFNAFCQAVQDSDLPTVCYGIDTWAGDEHGGFYGEIVYERLRAYNRENYPGFSRLMRSTFNEAVAYFADASIDLLHIDGRHRLEDVTEDFETWKPKLSPSAVVLFHDTNVRENNFGVWSAWRELRERYRSFEFFHGNGLGVMLMDGGSAPDAVMHLTNCTEEEAHQVRLAYSRLGASVLDRLKAQEFDQRVQELARQAQNDGSKVSELEAVLRECRVSPDELQSLREQSIQLKELSIKTREVEDRLVVSLQRTAGLEAVENELSHVKLERDLLREQASAYQQSQVELESLRARSILMSERADEAAGLLDDLRESRRHIRRLEAESRRLEGDLRRLEAESAARSSSEIEVMRLKEQLDVVTAEWEQLKEISNDINNQLLQNIQWNEEQTHLARSLRREIALSKMGSPMLRRRSFAKIRQRLSRSSRIELLRKSGLFDENWYSSKYQDVSESKMEPVVHFVTYGSSEGRDPGPYFSASEYLLLNPDVARSRWEPVFHFIRYGKTEGRHIRPVE